MCTRRSCAVFGPSKYSGRSRHAFDFLERAGRGVVSKARDGRIFLVQYVRKLRIRTKRDLPRRCARRQRNRRARLELACRGVELIREHPVSGRLAHEHELACGIAADTRGFHAFHDISGGAELPVFGHRQHRHRAVPAVGHDEVLSLRRHDEMARRCSHRCPLIDERQLAGAINREGADGATRFAFELIDLVNGKEQATLCVSFEERRIRRLRREPKRHQRHVLKDLRARRLQPKQIDALGLVACVGTDIDERRFALRRQTLLRPSRGGKPSQQESRNKRSRAHFRILYR